MEAPYQEETNLKAQVESDDANRFFFSNRHEQRKFLNSLTRAKKIEFKRYIQRFVGMCQEKSESEEAQKLAVEIHTFISTNNIKPARSLQRFVQNENNRKMKIAKVIEADKALRIEEKKDV